MYAVAEENDVKVRGSDSASKSGNTGTSSYENGAIPGRMKRKALVRDDEIHGQR